MKCGLFRIGRCEIGLLISIGHRLMISENGKYGFEATQESLIRMEISQ